MGRFGALIALLGLTGCDRLSSTSDSILPVQLSLLVEQLDGTPLSVVVDLRRNSRFQLDVRVSRGQRFFDGVHLWEAFAVRTDDAFTYRFNDLLSETTRDLPLRMATAPELLSIGRTDVYVGQGDRLFVCGFNRWSCAPTSEVAPPPIDHQGPARGFHVREEDGAVWLTLPMDDSPEGEPIIDNVRRVVGLHWIHERFFEAVPVLDRMYRGRANLTVSDRPVVVDGDLDDWAEAVPVVVESPWQIEDGPLAWGGPQDASFSVAAARSAGQLCFAGRVRDDHLVSGDAVHIGVGDQDFTVGLLDAERDWFGVRFEACLPVALTQQAEAFGVEFVDVDPGQAVTVLATSPQLGGRPTGTLRVATQTP